MMANCWNNRIDTIGIMMLTTMPMMIPTMMTMMTTTMIDDDDDYDNDDHIWCHMMSYQNIKPDDSDADPGVTVSPIVASWQVCCAFNSDC